MVDEAVPRPSRRTEGITFTGSTGAPLSAVVRHPKVTPRAAVLLAHCFTCSKDLHTVSRLARDLADDGYLTFRFDFTGLGQSGGEFETTSVSSNVADLVAAARALAGLADLDVHLVGHSLGGAAVLLAADRIPRVSSVTVIGAPSTPAHVRRLLGDAVDRIEWEGAAPVDIGGRVFRLSRSFLDDLARHDELGRVRRLNRPLLVLHAVSDTVVPVSEGEAIFAAAPQPKAFVALQHADHLLSDPRGSATAARILCTWLNQIDLRP